MSDIASNVPFIQRHYSNGIPTTLTNSVGTTISVLDVATPTNWPSPPYWIVVDRSTASQEVMEVTGTATVGGGLGLAVIRNIDGNGAYQHGAGAGIELSGIAQDWAEMSAHRTDVNRDDHLVLMRSDGTRHDRPARHHLGTSISVSPPSTSQLGDVASVGTGPGLDRADHVHGSDLSSIALLNDFLASGIIVPIQVAQFAYPAPLPPGLLWADGGWYEQSSYPSLFGAVGTAYPPFTALQNLAGLPNPVTSQSGYQQPYDPTTQFAVPCLLYWTRSTATPQWYWSPPDAVLPIGWAIVT